MASRVRIRHDVSNIELLMKENQLFLPLDDDFLFFEYVMLIERKLRREASGIGNRKSL